MKFALSALAALLIAPAALADSAFSDTTSFSAMAGGGSGSAAVMDTGFSFGGWAGPSQAQATLQMDLDADNVSFADAVEPANFGSDQAFSDSGTQSDFNANNIAAALGQDLGTAGSFAMGNAAFSFTFNAGGTANADANDD